MSKIENWSRLPNDATNSESEGWKHDSRDYQVYVTSEYDSASDQRMYVAWVEGVNALEIAPYHQSYGHSDNSGIITRVSDKESAMDDARSWMDDNPYPPVFMEGDQVPIMTEHGDVTDVEIVDPEPEKNTVVIRALEDDKRIGFMEGEETAVDQQQIEDAMDLEPYERRRLENEFQKQQNMMESDNR